MCLEILYELRSCSHSRIDLLPAVMSADALGVISADLLEMEVNEEHENKPDLIASNLPDKEFIGYRRAAISNEQDRIFGERNCQQFFDKMKIF